MSVVGYRVGKSSQWEGSTIIVEPGVYCYSTDTFTWKKGDGSKTWVELETLFNIEVEIILPQLRIKDSEDGNLNRWISIDRFRGAPDSTDFYYIEEEELLDVLGSAKATLRSQVEQLEVLVEALVFEILQNNDTP